MCKFPRFFALLKNKQATTKNPKQKPNPTIQRKINPTHSHYSNFNLAAANPFQSRFEERAWAKEKHEFKKMKLR